MLEYLSPQSASSLCQPVARLEANNTGYKGRSFLKQYHSLVPKTEPIQEYEDRVKLYESYHHLNHWAIFGNGYRAGAAGILRSLCKKYGRADDDGDRSN